MPAKTIPFDAAELLTTPEAQAEFLTDALETGDAGHIARALGIVAHARGMTEEAMGAGAALEALHRMAGQDGDPDLATLLALVRALGFTLVVRPGTGSAK